MSRCSLETIDETRAIGDACGRTRIRQCEGHQGSAGTVGAASVMDLADPLSQRSQDAALGDSAADGTARQRQQ